METRWKNGKEEGKVSYVCSILAHDTNPFVWEGRVLLRDYRALSIPDRESSMTLRLVSKPVNGRGDFGPPPTVPKRSVGGKEREKEREEGGREEGWMRRPGQRFQPRDR